MKDETWWHRVINKPHTSYVLTKLTQYHIPEAETFNLLGEEKQEEKPKVAKDRSRPVTHLRSKIILSVMTDQVRVVDGIFMNGKESKQILWRIHHLIL